MLIPSLGTQCPRDNLVLPHLHVRGDVVGLNEIFIRPWLAVEDMKKFAGTHSSSPSLLVSVPLCPQNWLVNRIILEGPNLGARGRSVAGSKASIESIGKMEAARDWDAPNNSSTSLSLDESLELSKEISTTICPYLMKCTCRILVSYEDYNSYRLSKAVLGSSDIHSSSIVPRGFL